MKKLIDQNTPDEVVASIQKMLNNTSLAIDKISGNAALLEEKAMQLRNHELMMADELNPGHNKIGEGLKVDQTTFATFVDPAPMKQSIVDHDHDKTCHEDVRLKLEEIPVLISSPQITGATTVRADRTYTYTVFATANFPGVVVNKLTVFMPDGSQVSKAGQNVVNGSANFDVAFSATAEGIQKLRVMAYDSNMSPSEASYLDVTVSLNDPPVLTDLQCINLPPIMEPNSFTTFIIQGGVDPNGDVLEYEILVPNGSPLVFDRTKGLAEGDSVKMTLSADAIRGTSPSFSIKANDKRFEGTAVKAFHVKANLLPVVTGLGTTIPYYLNPNDSKEVAISGATDPDNTFVYKIACDHPGVSFSKTSDLHENESFTMVTDGTLLPSQSVNFTITVTDDVKGTVTKVQACRVNTPPDMTGCVYTYDSIMAPGLKHTFKVQGATDKENHPITYRIASDCSFLSFDKINGITDNEAVTLTMAAGADSARGQVYNLTITAVDDKGGFSTVNKTFSINKLPILGSTVAPCIPPILVPGRQYTIAFTGTADEDTAQVMNHSLESSEPLITFSKTSGIRNGESIIMTVGSGVVRGSSNTVTIKTFDGLETVNTVVNTRINMLPVGTVTHNIDDIVKPNSTYGIQVSGATDVDTEQTLSYGLSSNNAGVTFSKTSGITSTDVVTMSVSSGVVRGAQVTITLSVTDGLETVNSNHVMKINILPVAAGVVITDLPEIITQNKSYPVNIVGGSDADGQHVTYSITSNHAQVIFNKTEDIQPGETINMITGASVIENTTITLTVTASDGLETAVKQVTTLCNTKPNVGAVTFSLPTIVKPNGTYACTLRGATDVNAGQNLSYDISCNNPAVVFSKHTGLVADESFDVTITNAARNDVLTFDVMVSDGLNSDIATTTRIVNSLPDLTTMTWNAPPAIKAGGNSVVKFSGITDVNSGQQALTIAIASSATAVTFDRTSGIAQNSNFTINVGSGMSRGDVVTVTATVSDGLETISKDFTFFVNRLPVVTDLVSTIPPLVSPGNSLSVSFTGAVDADGQALTYGVSSDNVNVTFGKTSGILPGENITMIVASSIARDTLVTVTVSVYDGMETVTKPFTTTVNALPVVSGLVMNGLPVIVKPSTTYPVNFTGASDTNASQAITYSVSSSDPKVSFTKASGIASGESIDMVLTADITRGTTVTFTVAVNDGLETVTKQFSTFVNTLPNLGSLSCNLPPVLKPDTTYPSIVLNGLNDVSGGQSLTMSITCDDPKVTFTKASGLVNNEAFNIAVGASARGGTLTFTVTATDGMEQSSTTFTRKVNSLPTVNAITCSGVPTSTNGGTSTTLLLNGAADADGQAVTYNITNLTGGISFNVTNGIAGNSAFTMNMPKVSANTSASFLVWAVDALGEASASGKEFSFTITPIMKTRRPVIATPVQNETILTKIVDGVVYVKDTMSRDYNLTVSPYETYVELDNDPSTDA